MEPSGHILRYLPHALLATALVAGIPAALTWTLSSSGTVTAVLPLIVIAVAVSLLAFRTGAALWKRHSGAGDLLFGELMIWGWVRRLWSEWRLDRAVSTILPTVGADGTGPEERVERLRELTSALEASDPYTHGHSRRVARYSATIARALHLAPEEVARIHTAAAVHDVGKLRTPGSVLRKRGRLTEEEFDLIKRHAVDGAELVAALEDPELTGSVRHHHERLDGSGYPDGLRGERIPLGARIIAVADTFDAIASTRPYRRGRTHREALTVLTGEAGDHLDPKAVRAFVGHYSDSRPAALWTVLAAVPERAAGAFGGALNAGSAALAGVAVAVTAAAGGAAAEPARGADSIPLVTVTRAICELPPAKASGHAPGPDARAAGDRAAARPRSTPRAPAATETAPTLAAAVGVAPDAPMPSAAPPGEGETVSSGPAPSPPEPDPPPSPPSPAEPEPDPPPPSEPPGGEPACAVHLSDLSPPAPDLPDLPDAPPVLCN